MKQWCLTPEFVRDIRTKEEFQTPEWNEWFANMHGCGVTRTPKNTQPFCKWCYTEHFGRGTHLDNLSWPWFVANKDAYDGIYDEELRNSIAARKGEGDYGTSVVSNQHSTFAIEVPACSSPQEAEQYTAKAKRAKLLEE